MRGGSELGLLSPKAPKLRVSIVIPVYNEEGQLALCLDAIASQTVKPFEVIVVDNNSTDATAAIASRYPFVKVLHEPQQGPSYARDCGFNAARGDIIGRLDGDSIITPNWVEKVQEIFVAPEVRAVSGRVEYRYVGLPRLVAAIDHQVRLYMTRKMRPLGEQFLHGSNMAIRRTAWAKVAGQVCHKRYMHEDIDLAAHLAGPNAGVTFSSDLLASVDWRQAAAGPKQFLHHVWSSDPVFAEHKLMSRRYERRVALFVSLLYPIIHVLYRGYNPRTKRFSFAYLLISTTTVRPSPVTQ
jgi:glycosyltransferase involved in cell wall biosynthesis